MNPYASTWAGIIIISSIICLCSLVLIYIRNVGKKEESNISIAYNAWKEKYCVLVKFDK